MRVFAEQFSKVLNNHKNTDNNVINEILLREVIAELDKVPTWAEFMIAVAELTSDKAPGLNNVPSNAFKTMSEANLLHHFNSIVEFLEDRLDYLE